MSGCYRSRKLSTLLRANVYLKADFALPSGSFKERGALNAMLLLQEAARKAGVTAAGNGVRVIAASAGNHALALAYHGARLGIPVTVVMPTIAPITKVQNCRDLGATVHISGSHIGEARLHALTLAAEQGLTYVHGFNDPAVIAGAGTMGLEIASQVPDVDAVVVPVGGAGLIAGIGIALKHLKPGCLVYGAEPASVPSLAEALKAGRPVTVTSRPTLADGLLVPCVGNNGLALAAKYVDKVVLVKEKYIALAMLRLVEMEKAVIEGGGAAGLAAMLQGIPELEGKTVVVPLCGGNVDVPVLGRVLEGGLAEDGRLVRFEVTISDRPGGIARLTELLSAVGVSVKDIHHERGFGLYDDDAQSVRVRVIVETAGLATSYAMKDALIAAGYPLELRLPKTSEELSRSSLTGDAL